MPGSGGVGAVIALAFAAFWLAVVVFAGAAAETAVDEAIEGGALLDMAVETETMVFAATTAADIFAAAEPFLEFLEDVVEFAGAAEAGFEGGFAEEGALEETLEAALEGAFDGALDPACEGALEGAFEGGFAEAAVFVTVFDEVPLTFIFVSTTTISLPLAAVSEPATFMPSRG